MSSSPPPPPPLRGDRFLVYTITAAIMVVGPLNFLLFRILYDSFGAESAFFVSQGVNAFYVVMGGCVLYPRMWRRKVRLLPAVGGEEGGQAEGGGGIVQKKSTASSSNTNNHNGGIGNNNNSKVCSCWPFSLLLSNFEPDYSEITPSMRQLPQKSFMFMALLDCAGTFLAAMGAVGTPGQIQTLLNQALIPGTMTASALFLGSRYSSAQYGGALTILVGALIAIAPSFVDLTATTTLASYSGSTKTSSDGAGDGGGGGSSSGGIMLYLASNVPMALSAVYKEQRFASDDISPLYLTQWVSIYQFLFGFVLMPLQLIPGIASPQGMTFSGMLASFSGGWRCYLQEPNMCPEGSAGTFWLLPAYVFVNYLFNTLGLFLTKHGGANLNSISYSMLLPLTTLSNALPFLGVFREKLRLATVAGLAVVLGGFAIYEQLCSSTTSSYSREEDTADTVAAVATAAAAAAAFSSAPTMTSKTNENGKGVMVELQTKGLGSLLPPVTVDFPPALPTAAVDPRTAAAASASVPKGGGSSPRQHRTASYQERLVLVPLPISGSVTTPPQSRRPFWSSVFSASSSAPTTSKPSGGDNNGDKQSSIFSANELTRTAAAGRKRDKSGDGYSSFAPYVPVPAGEC